MQLEQHREKTSCSPLSQSTTSSAKRFCTAIVGDAKCAEASPISKFTINNFAAEEAMIWKET